MQSLKRLLLQRSSSRLRAAPTSRAFSSADDDWNDAWEAAWLPEDLSAKNRAPWESDVHFDPEAKAFVEEMDERWEERRRRTEMNYNSNKKTGNVVEDEVATRNKMVGDEEYRLRKQRIHASLWTKEIENMDSVSCLQVQGSAEIDQLLNSCAEIFDSGNDDLNTTKIPGTSGFKTKPDGWETTSKALDGNIWDVTQREEDILLQEFERRIAFSKFQIASFIKTHIFSRRRPIDGWKYIIEEIGPNARKRKGSVRGLPALSDSATQPIGDEQTAIGSSFVL